MQNFIKLNNDYYIKIVNNINEISIDSIDMKNLKLIHILNKKRIIFHIDFSEIYTNEYKKILKKMLHLKNMAIKMNKKIGIKESGNKIVVYIINFNEKSLEQKDFICAINAIFYNSRYERYNYIYDTVCDYLDGYFYGKNLCDFQNNKCGEKRNTSSVTGCCHHFKSRVLGPISKLVVCEFLDKENHNCTAKCISCKLFTCDYLEKKGIKFKIKDILLLDIFFNPLQKYFIKYMYLRQKKKY